MKINIDFNNLSGSPIKKDFVEKIASATLEEALKSGGQGKKISLSFAVVSEEEIKKSNKTYRGKDSVTDILTFAEFKNTKELEKTLAVEKEVFLGEALLCYNDIEKYCLIKGKNLKEELATVISHGVLHMLGWKHGKKMFDLQKRIAGAS